MRDGRLEVDVLKVPHHGAHNSFSDEFVDRVRAANYMFCGDGEHHNPEPDVVEGYLRAATARPLAAGGPTQFWFNWSAARATETSGALEGGRGHVQARQHSR